jgi:hypothetical protein
MRWSWVVVTEGVHGDAFRLCHRRASAHSFADGEHTTQLRVSWGRERTMQRYQRFQSLPNRLRSTLGNSLSPHNRFHTLNIIFIFCSIYYRNPFLIIYYKYYL